MSCASSGHITKLKQSIFAPFDIYGARREGVGWGSSAPIVCKIAKISIQDDILLGLWMFLALAKNIILWKESNICG